MYKYGDIVTQEMVDNAMKRCREGWLAAVVEDVELTEPVAEVAPIEPIAEAVVETEEEETETRSPREVQPEIELTNSMTNKLKKSRS